MRREWTTTILLAAIGIGLTWFAEASDRAGADRSAIEARSVAAAEHALLPQPEVLADDSPSESSCAREPMYASHAEELGKAHWIDGRVVFPAGMPEDEHCTVVAQGRPFSDGSLHRCRVGADGRFRVAFSPAAKAGWLAIEGRTLYTSPRSRWLLAGPEQKLTLEPKLGAVVTGRLVVPAGARAGALGGEIELRRDGGGLVKRMPVLSSGRFAFERVPCGTSGTCLGSRLTLAYRGAAWLGRSAPFDLAPGETEHLDLKLVAGVVLGGKVRDERGRGIADARIVDQATSVDTRSATDGSFRLPALESGTHTLLVSADGYLRAKREFGASAKGTRRTKLVLVLERGAGIAGTVLAPDGSPVEARVKVTPQTDAAAQLPVSSRSASDGTFHVQGLLPGSYRLEASKVLRGGMARAWRSGVAADTKDLVLQLEDDG